MQVEGVHHVAIKARAPERVARFYREVLGLEPVDRHTDARGLRSVWLRTGGTLLMIERAETPGKTASFEADPPGVHLIALTISAATRPAWRARLEAAAHPVVKETPFTLYVSDPEGNRVGLSSWPHKAE